MAAYSAMACPLHPSGTFRRIDARNRKTDCHGKKRSDGKRGIQKNHSGRGQRNTQKAQEAAQQLIWFLAFLAIGVMALMYLAKGFILHTVFGQITAEVRSYAEVYLLIVAASIPIIFMCSTRHPPILAR